MSEGGPTSGGKDLADGDIKENPELNDKVDFGLTHLARDVQLVRNLHVRVSWAAAVPVLVLMYLLIITVQAYSAHLRGANEFLKEAIKVKAPVVQVAPDEKIPTVFEKVASASVSDAKKGKDSKAPEVKSKDEGVAKPISDQAHLYALLSSYLTSLSTSSVAVISILVIAIVVITVAILRSTLAVEPYDPSRKSETDTKEASSGSADKGYALPFLEFIKNVLEVGISTVKGKKPE